MKSLQLAAAVARGHISQEEADQYTDLRTLRSGAGWYVGTLFEGGPGTRDTDYFADENDADLVLNLLDRMYKVFVAYCARGGKDNTITDFAISFADVLTVCGLNSRGVGYRIEP